MKRATISLHVLLKFTSLALCIYFIYMVLGNVMKMEISQWSPKGFPAKGLQGTAVTVPGDDPQTHIITVKDKLNHFSFSI